MISQHQDCYRDQKSKDLINDLSSVRHPLFYVSLIHLQYLLSIYYIQGSYKAH